MSEARRQQDLRVHWLTLIVSTGVVLLAFLMEVRDDQRVGLHGWLSRPLPELCMTRNLTGAPCPGCGMTRSLIHLAHGRLRESLNVHHFGWMIGLLFLVQIPIRIGALCGANIGWLSRRPLNWFPYLLAILMLANWFGWVLPRHFD